MSDSPKHEAEKGISYPTGTHTAEIYQNEIDVYDDSANEAKYGTTQRGLKSRHIQLIALGGCIGTVSYMSFH